MQCCWKSSPTRASAPRSPTGTSVAEPTHGARMARERGERREQILQILASMLERNPGGRITTAALATEVGVSEAALYRHFPSKARMFEGLIVYIEDTLFTRISRILTEESTALEQCEKILFLILAFVEKNPGISRVLNADALAGET